MAVTRPSYAVNNVQQLADLTQNQGTAVKQTMDKTGADNKVYLIDTLCPEIDALDSANAKLTGNQTIAGVKTFSSSPIVPAPTNDLQASTKKYVDDKDTAQTGALNTHKSSSDHDGRYYTETETDAKYATKTELNNAVIGAPPMNSLTNDQLGTDIKAGSLAALLTSVKTSVVSAINELVSSISNLAGAGRTTETVKGVNDTLVEHKADKATAHCLTGDQTIYVATTGSDTTGNGSSGNPFATINHALVVIPKNMGNYNATISLAPGSYPGFSISRYTGPITINLTGDVTIASRIEIFDGSRLVISGSYTLTIHPSTDTTAIFVNNNSTLYITTSAVALNGQNLGNFTIFSLASDNSVIDINPPCSSVTLSNIAYRAFLATGGGMIRFGYQVVAVGTITGVWYVASGGIIFVNSHTGTGGTKILKEFGGMVKTGAGVDLT